MTLVARSKILIVDDSLVIRHGIKKILTNNDYDVIEGSNGNEAINKIEDYNPDCMILDLLMPDLNGFEVLEILKKKRITVPVIVLTADIQETSRAKCLELGVVDVLNKLPEKDTLLNAVSKAIEWKTGTSE